jgi:hypothetical protein
MFSSSGIFQLLLGGGGAAVIAALYKLYSAVRAGASTRQKDLTKSLLDRMREAEEDADAAADDRDFWRNIAGHYHWQLTTAGLSPEPPNPVPPSKQSKPSPNRSGNRRRIFEGESDG